jgi:hypothetical protein
LAVTPHSRFQRLPTTFDAFCGKQQLARERGNKKQYGNRHAQDSANEKGAN